MKLWNPNEDFTSTTANSTNLKLKTSVKAGIKGCLKGNPDCTDMNHNQAYTLQPNSDAEEAVKACPRGNVGVYRILVTKTVTA